MKVHQFMHEMRTTSAILGRRHGIDVTFEGDKAFAEEDRINLPSMAWDKDLTPSQVRAMRGFVDHEAGHIRHSDMPRVLDFYDKCKHNGKTGLKQIHNSLEDIWMEEKVMEEYRGSAKNLSQVADLMKTRELESLQEARKHLGKDPLEDFSVWSATLSITTVGRKNYGSEAVSKVMDELPEKLIEHTERWIEEVHKCKDSNDVITLAKSVYKLLNEDPNLDSKPEDFDPQSGKDVEEGENSPEYEEKKKWGKEGKGNPFGGDPKDEGGEGNKGEEPQWVKGDLTKALNQGEGDGASGAIGGNGPGLSGGYKVFTDRYDVNYKRGEKHPSYATDYLVGIVNSTNNREYEKHKARIQGNIMTMKSKLKRALLAKQQRDWDTGREIGRLDSKRLVAAATGSKTVFKRRIDREEEDTAITILVDLSGSMYSKNKANVARDCTIALSECLEGSNLTFNVVGFCNKRRSKTDDYYTYHRPEPLDTVYFKDFDNPLRVTKASIGQLPEAVGGNNSDYDFIVNAVNDLKKRPEGRKVLLVLSDGSPANAGGGSSQQLVKFCNQAARDAKRDGIECIGIGICSNAVKEIYDDSVVVHNVNDLSSTVFNKLTQLLIDGK